MKMIETNSASKPIKTIYIKKSVFTVQEIEDLKKEQKEMESSLKYIKTKSMNYTVTGQERKIKPP